MKTPLHNILVAGTVKNSFVDWPGKIAFVVFLGGCNFNCPHCHNHKILGSMSNILPWDSVLNDIKEQVGFIDGVVISGGEPTLHPHLLQIIDDIRALGLAVKLDTNGSNYNLLRMLVEKHLVDYVAMDVKAPLDKYRELGFIRKGENAAEILENVKKSIEFLKQLPSERSQGVKGVTPLFRTTPIPELTENDIAEIKKLCEGRRWVRNHFIPQA